MKVQSPKFKIKNYSLKFKIFNFSFLTFHLSKSERMRGFTLVEMMVALTIVGVLATLVISSLLKSQKRGYDARRQGDMRTIQNSFEQYFAVNGRYPQNTAEASAEFPSGSLPQDPRNNGSYVYQFIYDTSVPVGESYCGCALLELGAGNSLDADCNYGSGDYVCVSNLQ